MTNAFRRRSPALILMAIGMAFLALAAVQATRAAPATATANVSIVDFAFSPATVNINTGDTVVWKNTGSAPHTATARNGSFDSGILTSGKTASHTFSSAGSLAYYCQVHPDMSGTIVVGGANPEPTGTPSSLPSGGGDPIGGAPIALLAALGALLVGGGVLLAVRSRA